MKHTRVPRTVRRDIWRLAIETSSIPSLHIFEAESGIRSQVESKAGKARSGPNRKLNCLTKKKYPHTLFHYYLGWLMWRKVCISYEPSYKNNGDAEIQFAVRYFRPNESALYKLCTNINQPYLIWAAVLDLSSCSSNKGPIILGQTIHRESNRPKRRYVYSPWCWCCCRWLGVAPKMKSRRPIKIRITNY